MRLFSLTIPPPPRSNAAMGLGEISRALGCNRDAAFCMGYFEDMELTRTQTIMDGAPHCDFRYRMKSE